MVAYGFTAKNYIPRTAEQRQQYTLHEDHFETGRKARYVLEIVPQDGQAPVQLFKNTKSVNADEPLPEQDMLVEWFSQVRGQYGFPHEIWLTYIVPTAPYDSYLAYLEEYRWDEERPAPARGQIRLYTVTADNQLAQRHPNAHVTGELEFLLSEHLIKAKGGHTGSVLIRQMMKKKSVADIVQRLASEGIVGGIYVGRRDTKDAEDEVKAKIGSILKQWRDGTYQPWTRPIGFLHKSVTRGAEWQQQRHGNEYWIAHCVKAASKAFAMDEQKAATKQRAEAKRAAKRAEKKAAKLKPADPPPPVSTTPKQGPGRQPSDGKFWFDEPNWQHKQILTATRNQQTKEEKHDPNWME